MHAGSGRSFTAYVFSKADQAQRAQHALLAEASAAQLTSPRQLIQQIIAESPSPIATPDVAAASRFPFVLDSTVKVSVGSKGVEAADERLDGRAVDHSFDKENAAESRIAERDMAACDVTELKANSHYTTVEDSEHRDASTAQHVEGNGKHHLDHQQHRDAAVILSVCISPFFWLCAFLCVCVRSSCAAVAMCNKLNGTRTCVSNATYGCISSHACLPWALGQNRTCRV